MPAMRTIIPPMSDRTKAAVGAFSSVTPFLAEDEIHFRYISLAALVNLDQEGLVPAESTVGSKKLVGLPSQLSPSV